MGYTTDFAGEFKVTPTLSIEHAEYLRAFADTRHMKRDECLVSVVKDPLRQKVRLPIGIQGGYYVGPSNDGIIDHNDPPSGQPGLYCQWIPKEDRTAIVWDEGEKFYYYVEWITYLIDHFLKRWGYKVNGAVTWQGESHGDIGTIIVRDNAVSTVKSHLSIDTEIMITKNTNPLNERRFECADGGSNKFWKFSTIGNNLRVVYGKIGTKGVVLEKSFSSKAKLDAYTSSAVREKLGKGYKEVFDLPDEASIDELDFSEITNMVPTKPKPIASCVVSTQLCKEPETLNGLIEKLTSHLSNMVGEDKLTKEDKARLQISLKVWSKLIA